MKKITIRRGSDIVTITAPEDKEMVINESALAQRVLSIGEYGQSGIKIAAFLNWDEVWFSAEDHGYTIVNEDVF